MDTPIFALYLGMVFFGLGAGLAYIVLSLIKSDEHGGRTLAKSARTFAEMATRKVRESHAPVVWAAFDCPMMENPTWVTRVMDMLVPRFDVRYDGREITVRRYTLANAPLTALVKDIEGGAG